MATSVENITALALLCIIWLLMTPMMFYYLFNFVRYRRDPIICKRHILPIVLFVIFVWINMIGDKGLFMIAIIVTPNLHSTYTNGIYLASDYTYYICGPCIFSMFAIRTWLLFFDLKWMKLTKYDQKWKTFINPQQYNDDLLANNWFVVHRQTFGNAKFILLKIFTPTILVVCSVLSFSYYFFLSLSIHYFIFLLYIAIMLTTVAVIYCKLPRQQIEIFHIRQEIQLQLRVGISFIVFFLIYIILRILVFDAYTVWLVLLYQYICVAHYGVAVYVATQWVLLRNGLLHARRLRLSLQTNQESWSASTGIPLIKLLRNETSFQVFMQHLSSEMSMETLLCICECWQFKSMMKEQYPDLEKSNALKVLETKFTSFGLPDTIVQSEIVYDQTLDVHEKVTRLLLKYIKEESVFEVNVSGLIRDELMSQLEAIRHNQLSTQEYYDLFDETILELMQLLLSTCTRFQHTKEHQLLESVQE